MFMRRILLAVSTAMTLGGPGAAEVPSAPAALARTGEVSNARERLTVRIPRSARYIGSDRFELYGVADAEVHVYAEIDAAKRLRKLYWIQFESYLPSQPDRRYNYAEGNVRRLVRGTPTWILAGPRPSTGPTRPGSDREHVIAILKRAGIVIPPEVMNVRMVQILDDPQGTGRGRRELMVIYSEDLAMTGRKLAELTTDGQPNALWTKIEPALIDRATKAVAIIRK
jgi:hypothetical protein